MLKISDEDCFLSSDGYYKRPTDFTKSFKDVKLSCVGTRPDANGIASMYSVDYDVVPENLRHVQDMIQTPNYMEKQGLLDVSKRTSATHIKLRHNLFEVSNVIVHLQLQSPSS